MSLSFIILITALLHARSLSNPRQDLSSDRFVVSGNAWRCRQSCDVGGHATFARFLRQQQTRLSACFRLSRCLALLHPARRIITRLNGAVRYSDSVFVLLWSELDLAVY